MKTTRVGLLLLVLVSSTMAHEWSFKHESMMPPKKKFAMDDILKNLAGDIGDVNMGVETNRLVEVNNEKLVDNGPVFYCCFGNVISFSCGDFALLIDIILGKLLLCNRVLGNAIGIDCVHTTGCIIPTAWMGSQAIDDFVRNCDMQVYFSNPSNTPFNCQQPPTNVITSVTTIIVCISVDLFIQIMANQNACITIIINICVQITTLITVTLLGLLVLVSVLIIIEGGLLAFLAILLGLQDLLVTCNVAVSTLVVAGILLIIALIIGCSDGFHAMSYVLTTCGALINIAVIFLLVLTNVAIFLRVCVNLGGNILCGINGVIQLLAVILLFCGGFITLFACLVIVVRVCCCITAVISIIASVNVIINCLLPWQGVLVVLFVFLNGLVGGTCVFASINISGIVALVVAAILGTVTLIVQIIIFVTACLIVTICVFWCTLLRVFLFLTGSVVGRGCLNLLLSLSLSVDPIVVCVNVLGVITLLQVVVFLLTGVWFCLTNIDICNSIATGLNVVIIALTSTSLPICLLDPSAQNESNLISTWIQQQGC